MLAVLLLGAALWLALERPRAPRRMTTGSTPAPPAGVAAAPAPAPAPGRWAGPAALLLGVAVAWAVHPIAGLVIGSVGWWFLPALVGRLATSQEVRIQEALSYQLPVVAGLVSACLASGAPLAASLRIVSDAVQEPARSTLDHAARSAELGGGPVELATILSGTGNDGWHALGTAVLRSSATGAPLSDLLHEQADRALSTWHSAATVRARGVAVRTVLPLGVCYLPAFLLLGVAPVVAGMVGGLGLF